MGLWYFLYCCTGTHESSLYVSTFLHASIRELFSKVIPVTTVIIKIAKISQKNNKILKIYEINEIIGIDVYQV